MTPQVDNPIQRPPDATEPRVGRRAVPIWLIVLLFLLLYWGMVYFDERSGWCSTQVYAPYHSVEEVMNYQPRLEGPDLGRGKVVFDSVCALCHNPDGTGKPNQGPPFVSSEWVAGSPARLIRIPLYGLGGPITVNGQTVNFPASMPAMGAALPDEDVAAVLSYMRYTFGKKAPPITAEQVKAVKAQVGNRSQGFTPEELAKLPEK